MPSILSTRATLTIADLIACIAGYSTSCFCLGNIPILYRLINLLRALSEGYGIRISIDRQQRPQRRKYEPVEAIIRQAGDEWTSLTRDLLRHQPFPNRQPRYYPQHPSLHNHSPKQRRTPHQIVRIRAITAFASLSPPPSAI